MCLYLYVCASAWNQCKGTLSLQLFRIIYSRHYMCIHIHIQCTCIYMCIYIWILTYIYMYILYIYYIHVHRTCTCRLYMYTFTNVYTDHWCPVESFVLWCWPPDSWQSDTWSPLHSSLSEYSPWTETAPATAAPEREMEHMHELHLISTQSMHAYACVCLVTCLLFDSLLQIILGKL